MKTWVLVVLLLEQRAICFKPLYRTSQALFFKGIVDFSARKFLFRTTSAQVLCVCVHVHKYLYGVHFLTCRLGTR
jgi:hypothetical protein